MSFLRKLFGATGTERALRKIETMGAAALLAALENPDIEVRKAAASRLGQIGDPAFVKPLLVALDADARLNRFLQADDGLREVVVNAVARIGPPAIDLLITILRERDLRNQWYEDTVAALGKIGGPALAPLISVLEDWSAGGRKDAIDAVAEMGGHGAVAPIAALLEDRDKRIRETAAAALERLDWQPDTADARVRFYLATANVAALTALGRDAVEPLINRLKSGFDFGIIAEALGSIGDARAVGPLTGAFRESSSGEALDKDKAIIHALLKIGGSGVDAVIAKMDAHPLDTFHLFADVAPQLGSRGLESLTRALLSYPYIRRRAASELTKLGWTPDAVDLNAAYLMASEKWDECVDLGASAVPALVTALTGGEPYGFSVTQPAGQALLRIGPPAVEALISALHHHQGTADSFPRVADLLARIGDGRAIEPLVSYLKSNPAYTYRQAAANALRSLGWQPGTPEDKLAYWIATGDWASCASLGAFAVPALVGALATSNAPADPIVDVLVRIGAPAVDSLIADLAGRGTHIAHTIKALAAIGDPRALEPLEALRKRMWSSDWAKKNIAEAINEIQNGQKAPAKSDSATQAPSFVAQAAQKLLDIYAPYPDGIFADSPAARQVRAIGQAAHDAGGKNLMLAVHSQFAAGNIRMKRNLEMLWDNVGDWRG